MDDRESERQLYDQLLKELGPCSELRVNNHWVPVTYLKEFTDTRKASGVLWMYDREDPRNPKKVRPTAVAKENRLYVLSDEAKLPPGPAGEEPADIIERILDRFFEAPFSQARDWLVYGPRCGLDLPPPPHQWAAFSRFVAVQHTRTPATRARTEWMSAFHKTFEALIELQDPRAVQRRLRETTGESHSLSEIRRWRAEIERGDLFFWPNESQWLGHVLQGALASVDVVERIPWRLLRPPDGIEFPTSDTPVVMSRPKLGGGFVLGGGWLTSLTVFPIHPQCAVLFAGPELDRAAYVKRGVSQLCQTVRHLIIEHAQRFVFARTPRDDIADILESTEPLVPVVECGGEQYPMDGPVGPVAKRVFDDEDDLIRFGPPK